MNEWSGDLADRFESCGIRGAGGELSLPDRWTTSPTYYIASLPYCRIIPCSLAAAIHVKTPLLLDWTFLTCPLPVLFATTNTF